MKKCTLVLALMLQQFLAAQSFLRAEGQKIVNEKGENILLKGLGLGGWMLQEGYMLKTADFAGPQYQIENKIEELTGKEGKEAFYKAYLQNGITRQDIDSLAKWGFNSLRLPMHYKLYTLPIEKEPVKGQNTWLEKGFRMTDELLKWCAENKIYLILDLHSVPGGQGKDANISDYDPTKPSLWESEENKNKTIALWKKLAERYKDSPWIGGYDLINEPNWNFTGTNDHGCDEKQNQPLRDLQMQITKAIREIDRKHIIFVEGNCWGNNYNGIFPLWDNNLVLSFHKYWSENNEATIQQMLDYRQRYDVPIWLGETGENSNVWFTQVIQLMQKHNIGWAFWPMKKIDNIAGIANVKITPEYQELLDFWKNGGPQPSVSFAQKTLNQIAENYQLNHTEIKYDVLDAMFRQVNDSTTKAFKKHQIPGKVYAAEYDLGRLHSAYYDTDTMNLWVSDPAKRSEWNFGNQMRNDAVDIYLDSSAKDFPYYVGKTEAGEWLQYTFTLQKARRFTMKLEVRNPEKASRISIKNAEGEILGSAVLSKNKDWNTLVLQNIPLKKGENRLRIVFDEAGTHLRSFELQ